MTPNHADKTACAAQQSRGARRRHISPDDSTEILQGRRQGASPSHPPAAGSGQTSLPLRYNHSGERSLPGRSTNATWHQASQGLRF